MTIIPIANNCRLPVSYSTVANWVHNCWSKHRVGAGGCTMIQPVFVNGLLSSNSEQDAYYDFVLKAALYYKGRFTPFTFGGATSTTVSKSWGKGVCDPLVITMQPGDEFYITNRRVASDNGLAGTYNRITTTSGQTFRQDGIIDGTNPANDFTQGVGLAYGAKCLPIPVITDATGAIASIAIDPNSLGANYTAGGNIAIWYGPSGSNVPGSQNPGTGVSGYFNVSGGALTSVSVAGGGTLHRSSNPPKCFLGGNALASAGFGTATQSYGPSCILGIPLYKTPGALIMGDSQSSYGSVDTTGDLSGNYGFFEQALAARGIGYFNTSVSGESFAGWATTNTQQLAFINYLRSTLGMVIDNVLISLGTNDFNQNTNSNVISVTQGYLASMVTTIRAWGAKAIAVTVPPCTTSSDNWLTLANQTVLSVSASTANFASGGRVEQFNQSLLNGTVDVDQVIDASKWSRATGVNSGKFRVDIYGADIATTSDGIHYSMAAGIPFLLQNVAMPPFYAR